MRGNNNETPQMFCMFHLEDKIRFDHSVFSWNRDRLLTQEVAADFFSAVVDYARKEDLLSDDHFTVDGTLIESLASMKSFRRSYIGNALMENRHGLCVGFKLDTADGHAERDGAKELIKRARKRGFRIKTLGGDNNYGTNDFVDFLRGEKIKPHVSCREGWKIRGLDGRTTRHRGYEINVMKRKLIEQKFGWVKTIGGVLKSRFFGMTKTETWGLMSLSAYNILRIARLCEAPC